MTKYQGYSYNEGDGKGTLDPEDDAAHVNLGGTWRIPTFDEQEELHKYCKWERTTQNGIDGYKITSVKKGTSIFLPSAGCFDDNELVYVGFGGFYWTNLIYSWYGPWGANTMNWGEYKEYLPKSEEDDITHNRYIGRPIRAVCN